MCQENVWRLKHSRSRQFAAVLSLTLGAILLNAKYCDAQSPEPVPAKPPTTTAAFEVATIKPVKEPNPTRISGRFEGHRFTTRFTTVADLIVMAYGVDRRQIQEGPPWVTADEFDLDAVAADGVQLDHDQAAAILKELLTERFHLALHQEQREIPAYALVVAKTGSKLRVADANEQHQTGCERLGVCSFRNNSLDEFVTWLGFAVLDRPVVNQTAVDGKVDFDLSWTPDESQFVAMGIHAPPPSGDPNSPPGLFTAIQEQLGLKLEPRKTQVDVLVIDHVERPSEN